MNKKDAECFLKNSCEYINDTGIPIEHTTRDVWGKEVKIIHKEQDENQDKQNYVVMTYQLQNWYITLKFDESFDMQTIVEEFKYLVKEKEMEKILEYTSKGYKYDDLMIEELCPWRFLEGDDLSIILYDGVITMVKYAVVVVKEGSLT